VVLLTEWNLYRGMDMQRAGAIMRNRTFIDLRNVHERDAMESLGFAYHCVGR
jgi:UDPglucose 6-dehydrogenase